MGNIKIDQRVLKLKQAAKLPNGLDFPAGTEFEIVMDVVYMQGFPVPPNIQTTLYNWLTGNQALFIDRTGKC